MVILSSEQLSRSRVKGLVGSSVLKVFCIGQLRKLVGSLLSLEEVVVNTLDLGIVILAEILVTKLRARLI